MNRQINILLAVMLATGAGLLFTSCDDGDSFLTGDGGTEGGTDGDTDSDSDSDSDSDTDSDTDSDSDSDSDGDSDGGTFAPIGSCTIEITVGEVSSKSCMEWLHASATAQTAQKTCESQNVGTTTTTYSKDGCSPSGLVGTCTVETGTPADYVQYYYDGDVDGMKETCEMIGTWSTA